MAKNLQQTGDPMNNQEIHEENADYVLRGEAIDQEKVISLRHKVEEEVRAEIGDFAYTKLYWNMNERGNFDYQLYFFKEPYDAGKSNK
jgi:hypothetical protein